MRLSNDGLEIETENVSCKFPANFIIVNWNCEAVGKYDNATDDEYFEFEDIEMKCFYYDSENELIPFTPTDGQSAWILPVIETDAENQLEKQL